MKTRASLILATLCLLTACGGDGSARSVEEQQATKTAGPYAATDSQERLAQAKDTPEHWLTYGGSYDEQRHSRLTMINADNVAELGVAWSHSLGTSRGIESTPIVVDGVMYLTGSWSKVFALDAKTGKELWQYDPEVDRSVGIKACCDVVNRGVAVYGDKVFLGVIDGRLEAIDQVSGERLWSTVTVDQSKPYTITGAPRVVDGKVLIGNGGAELGVRGYLSAYDVDSGALVWRFFTTPNPNKQPDGAASDSVFEKLANDTWGDSGEWQTAGGGGTVWDSIVYDEVNDHIVFGVGNASPWNWTLRDPSGGDNLFVSSIVAVDADTGEYAWHFQTTPGDSWDYTATQSIILAELPLGEGGALRRIVMQAPKNGFFYVLDAASGEFISANNFVPQNWTSGLDENGRPTIIDSVRDLSMPYLQTPGPMGAHNWHPMAFNPELGLAFIPAQEIPQAYVADPQLPNKPAVWNTGFDFTAGLPLDPPPGMMAAIKAALKGRLIAWDPVTQSPRWSVEHNNAWNGGVLSTAGKLVFQGRFDGTFAAYHAETGERLWRADVKAGAASGPVTYAIDGEQYVTITTGWGSAYGLLNGFTLDETVGDPIGRVVTFRLGASGEVPEPNLKPVARTVKAEPFGDSALLADGLTHYSRNCMVCHGALAVSGGVLPDLRWSPYTANDASWKAVLRDGALSQSGMVSFADYLTEEEMEAIRAYVIYQGTLAIAAESTVASD